MGSKDGYNICSISAEGEGNDEVRKVGSGLAGRKIARCARRTSPRAKNTIALLCLPYLCDI